MAWLEIWWPRDSQRCFSALGGLRSRELATCEGPGLHRCCDDLGVRERGCSAWVRNGKPQACGVVGENAGSALRACAERCHVVFSWESEFSAQSMDVWRFESVKGVKIESRVCAKATACGSRVGASCHCSKVGVPPGPQVVLLQRHIECGMVGKESSLNSDLTPCSMFSTPCAYRRHDLCL